MVDRTGVLPEILAFLEAGDEAGGVGFEVMTPDQAREAMDDVADSVWPVKDAVHAVEDRQVAGPAGPIDIRIYRPSDQPGLPVLVFFHGGGWVVGSIATADGLCRRLAVLTRAIVVSIDYRLAPEYPHPAAVEDADAAVRWVHAHAGSIGIDPGRIALGGESAGGTLATVAARRVRNAGIDLSSQILLYPPTNAAMDTQSYVERASGFNLTAATMRWFYAHYLRTPADGLDPDCSPILADDLAGLPPAYILTSEFDPLRDEGRAYADRLRGAGVETTLEDWKGTVHGFMLMDGLTAVTNAACKRVADFLVTHWI